jgi:methylenetetrahydrofolate reductase (NADPH)
MRFADLLRQHRPSISFEFFPPKTSEAADELFSHVVAEFCTLAPSFVSVTYGAGGSTRERTRDLVVRFHQETDLTAVPHLTCVGATQDEIHDILEVYVQAGIANVLALRGDAPESADGFERPRGGFGFAAELVSFIKRSYPNLGVGVAGYPEGHPETPNKITDLDHLKAKVDAGADVVITQLFFDNRDFYDFVERCELAGIRVPIVAGIMPIQSMKGIMRMAGLSGARLPAALLRGLQRAGEDAAAIANVGTHWATEQCRDLLYHNVAGIHLYTLNKDSASRRIYENLGVKDSQALRGR